MKNYLLKIILLVCSIGFSQTKSNVSFIENHLKNITKTKEFRNFENLEQLNKIADYISGDFKKYSNQVSFQEYKVDGKTYKNVICSFGIKNKKRIVIGAHYDVCGNQQGADDNASRVTGLLELARLLQNSNLNHRIDLVAFTLEEPPYFSTKNMGSYIHAKSLKDTGTNVLGMISLEMIGYFSDKANSQNFPVPALANIYGNKGDFITIVGKANTKGFSEQFASIFKKEATIKVEIFNAPISMETIQFSDHLNYWKFGYSALMVTDTAFLRNKNYHTNKDTMEKLDLAKMSQVINSVYTVICLL